MLRPFEALLLDCDGVLVNSLAATEGAWRDWADRHGLDGEAVARSCHGVPSVEHVAAWAPHLDAQAESAAIEAAQVASREWTPSYKGASQLMWLLPPDRVAVVTSGTPALVTARLGRTGLPEPGVLVTADDVSAGKPSPEPYLLAASLLEVDPADCLVVEDSPAGVAAGRAAGAQVVAVTSTHAPGELRAADMIVSDLRELPDELRPLRRLPRVERALELIDAAFGPAEVPPGVEGDWDELALPLDVRLRWILRHPDSGAAIIDATLMRLPAERLDGPAQREAVESALKALEGFVQSRP